MTVYRVTSSDVEAFTIVANPTREYTSSSIAGSTGSVHVFPRRSTIEKEVTPSSAFIDSIRSDSDLNSELRAVQLAGKMARLAVSSSLTSSFHSMLQGYLSKVDAQSTSVRKHHALEIGRFTPSVQFTSNTMKKLNVKDLLNKYYRVDYPSAHWAYTNYHSLNFFTGSGLSTSSVLLYPNIAGGPGHDGYVTGTYTPSGSFSFDFYINPRYRSDQVDGHFKAGTILHLSSTYALSLITGSSKDVNGRQHGFRLQLQLSHSADVAPSLATLGNYPNDLTFRSNDNALKWNHWHHVVVRWGTNLTNAGTGSFVVDGVERGTFVVPSSTIAPRTFIAGGKSSPDVLCVGNYYEGGNQATGSLSYFFAADVAAREGVTELNTVAGIDAPTSYSFKHPLNAELHDLSIKRHYMTHVDLEESASVGPKAIDASEIALYVPPFFVEESPFRQFVGTYGGIPQTPFFAVDGTTNDPFNVALSFGVNGHYINIENFLRDFASNVFPRALNMSATLLTNTSETRDANKFLYDQPGVRARNLLIMPCDDGLFVPAYELLASESLRTIAVDDLGTEELSYIHLDNMVSTSSFLFGTTFEAPDKDIDVSNLFVNESIGFTPEQPGLSAGRATLGHKRRVAISIASGTFDAGVQDGAPLTIYNRTRDPSSNQVTFFDISNLYYGKRIMPGSLTITDSALSGSSERIGITLKDDGKGNIYRANSLTSASVWNSVGNVYYDEGVVVIKSPHLYFFGKEQFEFSFRGTQNIHTMKLDVLAPANQLNSSSNPNYRAVAPSPFPNDPERDFVYITNINFHDDNYNVIAKAQLAQPLMKRPGTAVRFRVKMDF